MYIDPEITHLKHLILSGKTEEGRTVLLNILQANPYHDQAWTLAAQFTSDANQRKIFIKRVFDCSNNMELADWAFQNFGKLEMGLESNIPMPPVDYLAVQNHKRIFLVELIDLALNPPERKPEPVVQSMSFSDPETERQNVSRSNVPIAPVLTTMDRQGSDDHGRASRDVKESMMESTLPLFSMKSTGKWIILGAGLLFICIVYMPTLNTFFLRLGFPPFYLCVLPLFFLGLATIIAGYFLERNE